MTDHLYTRPGLGRVYSPDAQDHQYLMLAKLPPGPSLRLVRTWNANGWWGNQEQTSMCVGFGWAHWLEDGPVTHKGPAPIVSPVDIYNGAQKLDEWPGEGYDGTSVRAGAKYLQSLGRIGPYHWAFDVETMLRALLDIGPIVMGTNWYSGMFEPDAEGIIRPTGVIEGGHCYDVNAGNLHRGLVRVKNSWGRSWGHGGHALMEIETLARLIREDGEACIAEEVPDKKAV